MNLVWSLVLMFSHGPPGGHEVNIIFMIILILQANGMVGTTKALSMNQDSVNVFFTETHM